MDQYNENYNIKVTETSKELKALSKMALQGLWQKALVGVIIYEAFITLIPGIISALVPGFNYEYTVDNYLNTGQDLNYTFSMFTYFYQFLLTGPIVIGFTKYLLNIVRRREVNNGLVLKGFEHVVKTFLLQFLKGVFTYLWCLPGTLVFTAGIMMGQNIFSYILIFGGMAGLFVAVVWASMRYSMAAYYMADDWNLSAMKCIKLSAKGMKGNSGHLIYVYITFLGWYLLASFIGSFIQTPFMGVKGVPGALIAFAAALPVYFVVLYVNITKTFFYEIMSGHLVKNVE